MDATGSSRLRMFLAGCALALAVLLAALGQAGAQPAYADSPGSYTVCFDANAPATASHLVTGSMGDQSFMYGTPQALDTNAYALTGWRFTGWNTAADGSGTTYADEQQVNNLAIGDGAQIMLYAQWEARTYTVTFNGGGGSGTMDPQEMIYDQPAQLSANGFSNWDQRFLGWSRGAVGALYADGATVVNACTVDENTGTISGWTLTAQWAVAGDLTVYVSNDDTPQIGLTVQATADGGASYTTLVDLGGGRYVLSELVAGTWNVIIAGHDAVGKTVTVADRQGATLVMNYATVEVATDAHAQAAVTGPTGTSWGTATEQTSVIKEWVPVGSTLQMQATTDEGYVFERYTALDPAPVWGGAPTQAAQTITVTGETTIQAHPRPARYQVLFDANGGTGDAMPAQSFEYGHEQNLFTCTYTREGYVFAGWAITPDQAGTLYTDGQLVGNLTATDGGTVTLYALWDGGGEGGGDSGGDEGGGGSSGQDPKALARTGDASPTALIAGAALAAGAAAAAAATRRLRRVRH